MKIYVIVQIYYIEDFVLADLWFFSGKGAFHIKSMCNLFFLVYFSIIVDILSRLISGFFPTFDTLI